MKCIAGVPRYCTKQVVIQHELVHAFPIFVLYLGIPTTLYFLFNSVQVYLDLEINQETWIYFLLKVSCPLTLKRNVSKNILFQKWNTKISTGNYIYILLAILSSGRIIQLSIFDFYLEYKRMYVLYLYISRYICMYSKVHYREHGFICN